VYSARAEISFNASWYWRTNGDVLTAPKAFRATEKTLTCFFGIPWDLISCTQAKMANNSAWNLTYYPREKLSLLPMDCPKTPALFPPTAPGPNYKPDVPLNHEAVPVPVIHCSPVNTVTLHLDSKLYAGFITSTLILNMESDCCSHTNILLWPRLGWS
jgi:hypothetical protein